jgi:hypothetical protein
MGPHREEASVYGKDLGGSVRSVRLWRVLQALRVLVAGLYLLVIGLAIYLIFLLADRAPLAFHASRANRPSQPEGKTKEGLLTHDLISSITNATQHTVLPEAFQADPAGVEQSRPTQKAESLPSGSSGPSEPSQTSRSISPPAAPSRGRESEGNNSAPAGSVVRSISSPRKVSQELLPVLELAREALQRHETASAETALQKALERFRDPVDQAKIARWLALCQALEEFWRVMEAIVGRLPPTHVIPVAETEVIVVESSTKELTLKVAGRVVTYPVRKIPPILVQELAWKAFKKDPQSKVVLAIYLAIEPKGDREKSRLLLLEAMAAGLDPGDMILELPAFFDPSSLGDFLEPGSAPERQQAVAAAVGGVTPETRSDSQTSSATKPPGASSQSETPVEKIRELYAAEFEGATTPAAKSRLARRLMELAQTGQADLQLTNAMITEARRLAVEAGDIPLVLSCVEAEARARRSDRTQEILAALQEVAGIHSRPDVHRELAQAALKAAFDAIQVRKFTPANHLLDLAISSGRKGGSRTVVEEAIAAKTKLQRTRRQ